ncbi:MAG: DUF559 domain-containing protein [Candidatus Paceibacterota bacterium]
MTLQESKLYEALKDRGISSRLIYPDGHKTIDIALPNSKLYIEIDGIQHYDDPDQIISDIERAVYSEKDGFHTIRFTNQLIDTHLDQIADAIVKVVKKIAARK